MTKDIEYKGIKYQEMDNEVLFKESVQKSLQGNNELKEIQKKIVTLERKKEVTLSLNLPIALIFLSTLVGVLTSYYLSKSEIYLAVIIGTIYLFIGAFVFIKTTNKLLDGYNKKIDLYDNIKRILQEDDEMANEVNEKNIANTEREKVLATVRIEDTCIKEYLEIVKGEYQIERSKRQSFESRAAIIITILTALSVFVFKNIQIKDIFVLMQQKQCSFWELIQIVMAIVAYGGFIIALFYALKTINVRNYKNFNVAAVNERKMGKPTIEGCIELVKTYKDIIIDHREENEKKAQYLKKAYTAIFASIIAIIVYVNINF